MNRAMKILKRINFLPEVVTTFRSHFSKILSALDHIFVFFCLIKVPFQEFCPFKVSILILHSRTNRIMFCVCSRVSKMRCFVHSMYITIF